MIGHEIEPMAGSFDPTAAAIAAESKGVVRTVTGLATGVVSGIGGMASKVSDTTNPRGANLGAASPSSASTKGKVNLSRIELIAKLVDKALSSSEPPQPAFWGKPEGAGGMRAFFYALSFYMSCYSLLYCLT